MWTPFQKIITLYIYLVTIIIFMLLFLQKTKNVGTLRIKSFLFLIRCYEKNDNIYPGLCLIIAYDLIVIVLSIFRLGECTFESVLL